MDLEDFKVAQVRDLMKTAFWQNEQPSEVNLLKIPIIMAPALLRQQVNNDVLKDSLLDKSVVHFAETFREFVKLVDNREIKIMDIGKLTIRKSLKYKRPQLSCKTSFVDPFRKIFGCLRINNSYYGIYAILFCHQFCFNRL